MGNLIWALAAVFCLQLGEPTGAPRGLASAWPPILSTSLAVLAAWWLAARLGRGRGGALLPAWGLAVHVLVVLGLDWLEGLRDLGVLEIPWIGMLLALAPFFAVHARAHAVLLRIGRVPREGRAEALRLRLELDLFPLLPFVFLDGCVTLAAHWSALRIAVEQIDLAMWCSMAVAVLLLLALLPVLVRVAWRLRPLPPGGLRHRLEAIAARLGFGFREIYVWPTGRLMANAAIIGAGMKNRIVVFTDLLLERLNEEEVEAVFAHEAAHARRHHVRRYAAFGGVALLAAWLVAEELGNDAAWLAWGPWSSAEEIPDLLRFGIESACLLAIAGLWWLGFGKLSRACEREADLTATRAVGSGALFRRALIEVCRSMGQPLDRGGWRHDSPLYRVAFQQRLERDPIAAQRFESRLRHASIGIYLAFIALLGAKLWLYVPELRSQWIRAELGWGAYDRVENEAHWFDRRSDRLEIAALARLGRSARAQYPEEEERAPYLLELARREAERGDLDAASRCLALARFEGSAQDTSALEVPIAHARDLRDAGFRGAFSRWERWCAEHDHEVSEALKRGVSAYLAHPPEGAAGL